MEVSSALTAHGLSPRVRGNLRSASTWTDAGRSIPACAGEPLWYVERESDSTVYPRVCGGTQFSGSALTSPIGLSPRVRGNRDAHCRRQSGGRSIPACAGEPLGCWNEPRVQRVYPRVCGGTITGFPCGYPERGLSPRVRGNRGRRLGTESGWRSIPACAGEPSASSSSARVRRVYPRVCGGTTVAGSSTTPPKGLSPRVRGNRARGGPRRRDPGSIPACAGEPHPSTTAQTAAWVYPRVCGGTRSHCATNRWFSGLSPRVRGNRRRRGRGRRRCGSIPACAGEPRRPDTGAGVSEVYPRVCGGTEFLLPSASSFWGLSPRVRGNHRRRGIRARGIGSIPACAGEPLDRALHFRTLRVYPRVCGGTIQGRRLGWS